ncbi:MAG: hypothetical protein JXR41_02455 [Bacteroidales bacterium]|nr:hypothetical protein [Bacteroidales bacterium]MBN2761925.1 hypothetical protein [Bacteroidales bacterium]
MNNDVCPKAVNCPIFSGILKGTDYTEVYKRLYCEAGEAGRLRCKRFQVAKVLGHCPDNLLPNSPKSVEEIIKEVQNQ